MTTKEEEAGTGVPPSRPRLRANGEPAPVALRMEDLTLWVVQHVAKMPREHRFAAPALHVIATPGRRSE